MSIASASRASNGDDPALRRILVDLGAGEVRLKNLSDGKEISAEVLKDLLEQLSKLSRYGEAVGRSGGDFDDYLSARGEDGALPEYVLRIREGNEEHVEYPLNEDALKAFSEANPDLKLFGTPKPKPVEAEAEEGAAATDETSAAKPDVPVVSRRAQLTEIHEARSIRKLLREMKQAGLAVEHFSAQDNPLFELVEGEADDAKTHPLFSVPEILETVLEIGKRGIEIQRYKGLGEMNAKQLFETTMDPTNRKLLRVTLNEQNAVEADKMFTVLMGDVVEPRKQFIEDNALNVRNLDV